MAAKSRPNQEDVEKNRLLPEDAPIHQWYRFVLGYPPHLVREYLAKFDADPARDWVFDPFSGTGTTPVEARLRGFRTVATDANPITALATRVKLRWDVDTERAKEQLAATVARAHDTLLSVGLAPRLNPLPLFAHAAEPPTSPFPADDNHFSPTELLPPEAEKVIPTDFISPKPLLRVLAIRHTLQVVAEDTALHELLSLALANTIVSDAGNMGFGPEVYLKRPLKEDVDVVEAFERTANRMIGDLEWLHGHHVRPFPTAHAFRDDARNLCTLSSVEPIGIVISSPPYPNEKDYTRSTRLESVLLGLMESKSQLRDVKNNLLRSNTRNVFVHDDDYKLIADISSINKIADEIEARRIELGKTSGFERMYHQVTRHYFGGMHRHLAALWPHLRPGARLAYVVGDQASYFQITISTAQLLADVAVRLGYEVQGIELWRTRWSSKTKQNIDENVLLLRRPY